MRSSFARLLVARFVPLLWAACAADPTPRNFPVGVRELALVDATRGTAANGSAPASAARALPTTVWYPARAAGVDAAPARGPFPLALFVHGSSGSRRQSTFLTEALAADGWIVAAADFPLTAGSTPGGASDRHVDDQLGDLRFLADQIVADGALAAIVDGANYAVIGHSTGGTIALLAADAPDPHDDRVRAAVALAPCACFLAPSLFADAPPLPRLIAEGTDDLFVPPASNGARAFALSRAPTALATLIGGNHLYFTDFAVDDAQLNPTPTTSTDDIAVALARWGGASACAPVPPPAHDPALSFDEQHALAIRLVTSFLDGALRGDSSFDRLAASPPPPLRVERR